MSHETQKKPSAENAARRVWPADATLVTAGDKVPPGRLPGLLGMGSAGGTEPFVFSLRYCEPPEGFGELSRYVWELDLHTGTRGEFSGFAVIGLGQWIGSEQSEYLDAFLAYLYDHRKRIRYVFTVPAGSRCSAMQQTLGQYFTVKLGNCLPEDERRV